MSAPAVNTFYARVEKALRVSATGTTPDGRLAGATSVDLADTAGNTTSVAAPYELFGPGDVQRLAAGAITRRFPSPNASDAESAKYAHVEFSVEDLPWRYTPRIAAGGTLQPWLVLIVAERSPAGLVVRPDGRVNIGTDAQAAHPLAESYLWAHVQRVDQHPDPIARILSPVTLEPTTSYVACVVPAFAADGSPSWSGASTVTCDLYDSWSFSTGPSGDFPELARKLRRADLAAIDAASGKVFGRADVTYVSRADPTNTIDMQTAGALRLPVDPSDPPDPIDQPIGNPVDSETVLLSAPLFTPDGRGVITAPRYEEPFRDPTLPTEPTAGGWGDQLRRDPRQRGAAGFGVETVIAWQDQIANAASARAGDLWIAHDRIGHVALGIEASRSLWRRRMAVLPEDGADPEALGAASASRLGVLAPALGRIPTTDRGSALDALVGRTTRMTKALLSSAGRRALRPGPARTSLAATPRTGLGGTIITANACVAVPRDPGLWTPDKVQPVGTIVGRGYDPSESIKAAIFAAAAGNDALAEAIVNHLLAVRANDASQGPAAFLSALALLAADPKGTPDDQAVMVWLKQTQWPEVPDTLVPNTTWADYRPQSAPCDPFDLVAVSAALCAAVDPTALHPPAELRVLATLPGIASIAPVEIEPELDLPLWSYLATNERDWMLPGAGDLRDGDVVALSTNPTFVEALLLGANYQATGELRWRNIPLVTRSSPLRRFWQRADGTFDILPIKSWPDAAALGAAALAPTPVPPEVSPEAVVAFRTQLFRRYPATVVYLYPRTPVPGSNPEQAWQPETAQLIPGTHVEHTFRGTIGDDITFFGFPISPEALKDHWVVLEEPPTGYRFASDSRDWVVAVLPGTIPARPDTDSAVYALRRFALPVRVMIGPLL